jgi:alpha-1,6-mannosyltransferase
MDVAPATDPDHRPDEPDRPPWRRWRPSPYLLLSTVVVLGLALIAARRPWIGDFGLHAAVVERLRADLLDPGNPQVAADTASPYYSPYTVLLALVARLTGASGVTVLTVAAPFCVALLLYGLRRFVAVFTDSRWAPVLALVFVPLLWGPDAPAWSGFLALRGLPLISPYPSTVATALMLLCWAVLAAAVDRPRWWRWALVGLLGVLTVLVHPFTGACAVLGVLALAVGRVRRLGRAHLPGLAAGLVLALVIALSWPYFSVLGVLSAADDFDAIHVPLYRDPLRWYGLGFAVGLPAVLVRLRRDRLDPLAALFLITLLVVTFGGLTGRYALGRVWPVVLLSLQVALAVELADALPGAGRAASRAWVRTRRGVAAVVSAVLTAAACVAGFSFQYGNLLLVLPQDQLSARVRAEHRVSRPPNYGWAERHIAVGDVVLSDNRDAARALLRDGARFVTPPWPDPFLSDETQRAADQATMLNPATPAARRRELLDRYGVDWILTTTDGTGWVDSFAAEAVDGPGRRRLLKLR